MKQHLYSHKCKECGKEIFPTPQWVYKREGKHYCSWTCYRKSEVNKPKPKVIIPKVGDTIRIIRTHPLIHWYSNKVGVVEFIDIYGQLFGTWGELQIVPETDEFEIIKEGEVNDEQI